jgi:hypothetical protein
VHARLKDPHHSKLDNFVNRIRLDVLSEHTLFVTQQWESSMSIVWHHYVYPRTKTYLSCGSREGKGSNDTWISWPRRARWRLSLLREKNKLKRGGDFKQLWGMNRNRIWWWQATPAIAANLKKGRTQWAMRKILLMREQGHGSWDILTRWSSSMSFSLGHKTGLFQDRTFKWHRQYRRCARFISNKNIKSNDDGTWI